MLIVQDINAKVGLSYSRDLIVDRETIIGTFGNRSRNLKGENLLTFARPINLLISSN